MAIASSGHGKHRAADAAPADPHLASAATDTPGAEALFREARRRERRRRLAGLGIAAAVLGGSAIGYVASRRTGLPARPRSATRARTSAVAAPAVALRHPYGLAVSADGTLYVVDVARDQVLRRLPDGRFAVAAGNGRQGFAGDGGLATRAELRLTWYSGIAVAKDGTLYVADSGNDRVRAVLRNGRIETVAGDGKAGLVTASMPATTAPIGTVAGLALAPNGDLYMAARNVLALSPTGTVSWVAGKAATGDAATAASAATEADFAAPDQLAFDGSGDLFVSSFNNFGLYEITAAGTLVDRGPFRGDGGPGALASAPDGSVVGADRGIERLTGKRATVVVSSGRLDAVLGQRRGPHGAMNTFVAGDGLAVGPNGTVYADTNTGNTFTTVSALVAVSANGHVTDLWRS